MNNTLWLAIIAMFTTSLSSPVLMAWFQYRNSRKNTEIASAVAESKKEAAEYNKATTTALERIHALVNGGLMAAQERELNATREGLKATRAMLDSMREVVSLKEDRGIPVSKESRDSIKEVETRIITIVGRINDMKEHLEIKQKQIKLAEASLLIAKEEAEK